MVQVRNDWTVEEINNIYSMPLLELVFKSASIHRQYNQSREVQLCALLSIKTGGCPEDCAYCPQSIHYQTNVDPEKLMELSVVLEAAKKAKSEGATRLCMGAAWREVKDGEQFNRVLEMVKAVNNLEMEVCCTLGMLKPKQALQLKQAGLYAYNHNLDTSEEYYGKIISTRKYKDRLNTLQSVRDAEITVCSGGIIGLGESDKDRMNMLHTLSTLTKHPESVPINVLVRVAGTPLEKQKKVPIWELVRMIATARILMPNTVVRLSAGRMEMSDTDQAFCFLAGANSIFTGDELLTTPNPGMGEDMALLKTLGLIPRPADQKSDRREKTESVLAAVGHA